MKTYTPTKALKIVVWDRTNNISLGEFSNPPLGLKVEADLENWTMNIGTPSGLNVFSADIAPGDVIELRVTEGVLNS